MKILFACGFALGLLSGCASVTQSNTQLVTVKTVCEGTSTTNVPCTLSNDKGMWSVESPNGVTVSKSYENLAVRCEKQGALGHNTYQSKNNVGTWGNILLGGGVGYLVDVGTGSGFNYPESVTIVLDPPCPAAGAVQPSQVLKQ